MFSIEFYLRNRRGPQDRSDTYCALDDRHATDDLFAGKPRSRHHQGKIIIKENARVFLDLPCEIDYCIACICDQKQAIFSGTAQTIDNSYFALSFLYRDKLTIMHNAKAITVTRDAFIHAFHQAALQYVMVLDHYGVDTNDDRLLLNVLNREWQ